MTQREHDHIRDDIKSNWNGFIKDYTNKFQTVRDEVYQKRFKALDNLQVQIQGDLYEKKLYGMWKNQKNVSGITFSKYLGIFKGVLAGCIEMLKAIKDILENNAKENRITDRELELYDIDFKETFSVPNELNIDIDPQSQNNLYSKNLENTSKMQKQFQILSSIRDICKSTNMSLDGLEFDYKKCKNGANAAKELLTTMLSGLSSTNDSTSKAILRTKAHSLLCEISRQVHGFLV